jgi:hypothetical protein
MELSPEGQARSDKELVVAQLRRVISDKKSTALDRNRAIEILGRLSDYSWFARPSDPTQQNTDIDANVVKRLVEIAERLEGECPHCGKSLSL